MPNVVTLVLLLALLMAASVASFSFSRFGGYGNQRIFGWIAVAVGTTCVLGAVTMVVLSGSYLAALPWGVSAAETPAMIKPADSRSPIVRPSPFEGNTVARRGAAVRSKTEARALIDHRSHDRPNIASEADVEEPRSSQGSENGFDLPDLRGLANRKTTHVSLDISDPWAATQCVVPMRLDPADSTRWTIENECSATVGIVIATCARSGECLRDSWKYEEDGVVLPMKALRSVSAAEQTIIAEQLQHAACVITAPRAIELIAESGEVHATEEWGRAFAVERLEDECLGRIQRLSSIGLRTGVPIDVLINAPLRMTNTDR